MEQKWVKVKRRWEGQAGGGQQAFGYTNGGNMWRGVQLAAAAAAGEIVCVCGVFNFTNLNVLALSKQKFKSAYFYAWFVARHPSHTQPTQS
jgi:hypothetical protein